MAAPTPTARTTPSGIMLYDGFKAFITFSLYPGLVVWEKTVTPPSIDGGDKIDITTMFNSKVRTFAPRKLYEHGDGSSTVAYDPKSYNDNQMKGCINRNQTVTYTFSDGSTYAVYGYPQKWEPQEMSEGEQPEAEITVVHTNWDPVNKVEAEGVLTEVAGT